jgi:hypothetical protein
MYVVMCLPVTLPLMMPTIKTKMIEREQTDIDKESLEWGGYRKLTSSLQLNPSI